MVGGTVMCEKGEKERAEDVSLRSTSVHDDTGGGKVTTKRCLLLRKSDVQAHSELPSPRMLRFCTSLLDRTVLKPKLKSTNSVLTQVLLFSRCESAPWSTSL